MRQSRERSDRGGRLPEPEADGARYLKFNALKGAAWG
ncbi:hypothetical protein T190_18050 [Sinorhizobium meliloti CCBAU 01290]|nr:hypothetical protein T190_18050 [Sinorhizobium meliloti CCBAU 01290]